MSADVQLVTYKCLHGLAPPYLSPVYSDTTQLDVELSCVRTSWPISVARSRQILLVFSMHPDSDSRTVSILLVGSCIVELAAGTPSGPGAPSQRDVA